MNISNLTRAEIDFLLEDLKDITNSKNYRFLDKKTQDTIQNILEKLRAS